MYRFGAITAGSSYYNYSPQQNGFWGGSAYGGSSCSASGTIETVFTWTPDYPGDPEPAPKSVIVEEECNTSGGANAGGASPSTDADANNGLDHTKVKTSNSSGMSSSTNASCNGVRYKVVTPAADGSVTLSCSPYAWASATTGYPRYQMSASASVMYRAKIYPVQVGLVGYTFDMGALKVLTGQRITASLSTSGFPLVDAQGNPTDKPTWSFASGGNICFGDFYLQVAATYNSASEVLKALTELGAAPTTFPATFATNQVGGALAVDFDVSSLRFYTKEAGTVKVSATARVKFPDNTTAQVTGESESLQSFQPLSTFLGRKGLTRVVSAGVQLEGDPNRTDNAAHGMDWKDTTVDPPPSPFSGGQFAFFQLVTNGRTGYANVDASGNASGGYKFPDNGKPGLDAGVPYLGRTYSVGVLVGSNLATEPNSFGDIPGVEYAITALPTMTSVTLQRLVVSDSFVTYLMFRPSGAGATWVPLRSMDWAWNITADRVVAHFMLLRAWD